MRCTLLSIALLLLVVTPSGCGTEEGDDGAVPPARAARQVTPELVERNNRGVGLMGQFEYADAEQVFAELVEQRADLPVLRVNLAIAQLNQATPAKEAAALENLESVLRDDDADERVKLRARYAAGLITLYQGATETARAHFRAVCDADPDDAHAAYFLGQAHARLDQRDAALQWYERAIGIDPYLRSPYNAASLLLRRAGREAEADELLATFQKLEDNPRASLVEFVYTRMGPKAEAVVVDAPGAAEKAPVAGPAFGRAAPIAVTLPEGWSWRGAADGAQRGITVADVAGDATVDVFVPGALVNADGAVVNAVLVASEGGAFALDVDHPLAGVPDVNAALWGDWDNDGRTDVYLLRDGPNQLWQRAAEGWSDVTDATGTAAGGAGAFNSVDGLMFDADHDADVDLFVVNADGPNVLLNNNRDGTFRDIAAEAGIDGGDVGSRQVAAVDLDRDRDLDLIMLNDEPLHAVYGNELLWSYEAAAGFDEFLATDAVALATADVDADGQVELYALGDEGAVTRWTADADDVWRATALRSSTGDDGEGRIAFADVTGDGVLNLIVSSGGAPRVFEVAEDRLVPIEDGLAAELDAAAWTLAMFDPEQGPALLMVSEDGRPMVAPPGPGRYTPFLALTFSGMHDPAQSMRSNASGIGTDVAVRADSRWTIFNTLRWSSGPGQSVQPIAVGLGEQRVADFIRIEWSDGVMQTELAVPAGLNRIVETQRQLSSCPVIFAWDGERYRFVSDVLGVGGMGFNLGKGEYAPPRPWENFMMPADAMQPRDGRFIMKIAEPMEEACYLDAASLVAYDLPPGWRMTLDERMGTGEPMPTGEVRFYRRAIEPRRVVNDRGEDVTDAVRAADCVAAPVGGLDRRFLGRLADEHVLTLEFDGSIDAGDGAPMLIAEGWVEYPYSQTMFAAWQAGAAYDPPTIEARGSDGVWRVVAQHVGYPAGMPREMSVPLDGLPAGTTALRVRTNMQVYWDRLAVAFAEPCPDAKRTVLPLAEAMLGRPGFAQRAEGLAQFRPLYDYADSPPLWDTRHQRGWYTAFGRVDELVASADDALAIFGPGEEVELQYEAPVERQPAGWRRVYVLEAVGWCKDMDLYTRDGETLAPLPGAGHDPVRRDRLHERYNTRYESGR